jgi:4-hydroxy-tetrahydrodipicolinate reductase
MKIAVNGAKGKMGRAVVEFVRAHPDLSLAGEADLGDDLGAILDAQRPDVLVDFTAPRVRMEGIRHALRAKVACVVGTTGYDEQDLQQIRTWVNESGRGCLIAPNFQLGNVLMQVFAQKAAAYFEYAEIIEFHHEEKADYPSGTAIRTAALMAETRKAFNPRLADSVAKIEGARGGEMNGIRLHAVRMPGFVASQEVILGAPGQTLKIRHDSIDRASYMPGVLLAAKHIVSRAELVFGLETILELK